MSHQLSEEQLSKLKEEIRQKIREFTGTANVDGYATPYAFGKDTKGDKKRKVNATGDDWTLAENRWLELKRDDSRTSAQKISHGIREMKNQISEIERFLGWYNRLRVEGNLAKTDFFKRTNSNIYRIKERLINIAKTIQEIDK